MSTSGLFHYNRTKCVSGDCAMAYIRNMEFCTKYGPPNGAYLPSYVQVQCKLTAHTTSLLAKCARVESTSNSIAYFRCNDDEFAILSLHSRTHTLAVLLRAKLSLLFVFDGCALSSLERNFSTSPFLARCNPYSTCVCVLLDHVCAVHRFDTQ